MAAGRHRRSGERRSRVRPAKFGRTSSRIVAFCRGRYIHIAAPVRNTPGLIHKDIKPENVLVDDADSVWLTGFGIASRQPRERQPAAPPETISGTLAYMAPEQTGWPSCVLGGRAGRLRRARRNESYEGKDRRATCWTLFRAHSFRWYLPSCSVSWPPGDTISGQRMPRR